MINSVEYSIFCFFRHVKEAAKKQLDDLWHTTNIYYHPALHEYAEALAEKMPGNLKVIFSQVRWLTILNTVKYLLLMLV